MTLLRQDAIIYTSSRAQSERKNSLNTTKLQRKFSAEEFYDNQAAFFFFKECSDFKTKAKAKKKYHSQESTTRKELDASSPFILKQCYLPTKIECEKDHVGRSGQGGVKSLFFFSSSTVGSGDARRILVNRQIYRLVII